MTRFRDLCSKSTALAVTGLMLMGADVPPDTAAESAAPVLSRFVSAVRSCGVNIAEPPKLVVKSESPFMFFEATDNTIHISRWGEVPPPFQSFITEWSKQSTLGLDPPAMFSEIFNSLLVSHELGHYLQARSGRLTGQARTLDHWQAETEANEIAIAFWSIAPDDKVKIANRVVNFERFLGTLPNPVPSGSDPHTYFEANYERLGADPVAYGWYQGAFMRAAWANRTKRSFCEYVKMTPADQMRKTPPKK